MKYLLITLLLMLAACATPPDIRPGKFTSPTKYLQGFPVGKMTEQQLIDKIGAPDNQVEIGGHTLLVYYPFPNQTSPSYSYIVENGMIADVRYNERGSLNGITAISEQTKH